MLSTNSDIFWSPRLKIVLAGDKLLCEQIKPAKHENECHERRATDADSKPNACHPAER